MPLSPAELAAAKAFRTAQRAILERKNASDPPGITTSVLVRNVRHDCAARGGKSVSLELREHYVFSWAYHVCDCGEVCCQAGGSLKECGTCGPVPLVPAKRFGFIFTEGRCGCGMTARSGDSRLVDPAVRPPSEHAIVTGLADTGSVSEKPGHILEIPDSLGRDVDRFHAGTGPAPPMEAFMSDASLEQVERQTAAAAAPVHAGDLRPISPAEAARRTTFDGQSLPAMPASRRVIPAPFRRDRISGAAHHGKTWQRVRADQVRAGDIVPDLGLVTSAHERLRRETVADVAGVATRVEFVLSGAGGVVQAFRPDAQVQVFRS